MKPMQPPSPSSEATPGSSTIARAVRVGVIGARGHTGSQLLKLIDAHPTLELAFAASRSLVDHPIRSIAHGVGSDLKFIHMPPEGLCDVDVDVIILALPNAASPPYVRALDETRPSAAIVDLSADHRFDDAWVYGLPELNRDAIVGAMRVANPGCYATAMMLGIAPLKEHLDGRVHVFGVSGFSGAGSSPCPRNDVGVLYDNILPYQLADHMHEREVTHQLHHDVRFAPHVGNFFQGLSVTIMATLKDPIETQQLFAMYHDRYVGCPLINVVDDDVPTIREAARRPGATIGGLTVSGHDPRQVTVVATLDNLLKGAAVQALQNVNLAMGFADVEGVVAA